MASKALVRQAASRGNVVIAGADPAFRRRLCRSLDGGARAGVFDVAAHPDLQRHVAALLPSVILVDLGPRPKANALGMVSTLSALAKTIVLADGASDALAVQALKAGASGFCARGTATALIRKAVQLVEAGEIWVGRHVMLRLVEELARLRDRTVREVSPGEPLTSREREIAMLVGDGASNKQIASHLSISIKTVKTHLTNIFQKLGVETRLQLALALPRAATPTKVR